MDTNQSKDQSEILRQVMRKWATGVAVMTSVCGEDQMGITINSFTSLSLDPPLILVNVSKDNPMNELFRQCRVFGLSILDQEQREISRNFARMDGGKRLACMETFSLKTGAPLLSSSMAYLDCDVFSILKLPGSVLIIGEVVDGRVDESYDPLLYFDREYVELRKQKK